MGQETASAVDQQAIVDDFFSKNPAGGDYVNEEGLVVDGPEQKQEKQNNVQDTEKQEVQQQQSEQTEQQQPDNWETQTKQDDFSFMTDKGDFDASAALDFLSKSEGKPRQQTSYQRSEPSQQQAIDTSPPAPEQSYEDTLSENINLGFKYYEQYLQQGHTPENAMIYAKQAVQNAVKDHLYERRFSEYEQKMITREKEFEEKQRVAQMQSQVNANLAEHVKEFKSLERLNGFLLNKEYGGDLINVIHDIAFKMNNPHTSLPQGDDLIESLKRTFNYIAADRSSLGVLIEAARGRLQNKLQPKLLKYQRDISNKQQTQKQMQKVSRSNLDRPGRLPPKQEADAFDKYLNPQVTV